MGISIPIIHGELFTFPQNKNEAAGTEEGQKLQVTGLLGWLDH